MKDRCEKCRSTENKVCRSASMPYGRRRRVVCLDCGHLWTVYVNARGRRIDKPRDGRKAKREPRRTQKPNDDPVSFSRADLIPRRRIVKLMAETTTQAVRSHLERLARMAA